MKLILQDKEEHMEKVIKPRIGFDQVKLGQSRDEVSAILGKADAEHIEKFEDGSENQILSYDVLDIELTFSSEDDNKLGTITFNSAEFTYEGKSLIGISEDELLLLAKNMGLNDLEKEEVFEDLNAQDYFSKSSDLSFWIQDGKVDSISLFPEYEDDDETIIWPK